MHETVKVPFNIKDIKEGTMFVTSTGCSARIICSDLVGDYPIVAAIMKEGNEYIHLYDINGNSPGNIDTNLYRQVNKKTVYVNIYKLKNGVTEPDNTFYNTYDEAIKGKDVFPEYLCTKIITWNE